MHLRCNFLLRRLVDQSLALTLVGIFYPCTHNLTYFIQRVLLVSTTRTLILLVSVLQANHSEWTHRSHIIFKEIVTLISQINAFIVFLSSSSFMSCALWLRFTELNDLIFDFTDLINQTNLLVCKCFREISLLLLQAFEVDLTL